jgi:hypothetical protein
LVVWIRLESYASCQVSILRNYRSLRLHLRLRRLHPEFGVWFRSSKHRNFSSGPGILDRNLRTDLSGHSRFDFKNEVCHNSTSISGKTDTALSGLLLQHSRDVRTGHSVKDRRDAYLGHRIPGHLLRIGEPVRLQECKDSTREREGTGASRKGYHEKQETIQIEPAGEAIGLIEFFPVKDTLKVSSSQVLVTYRRVKKTVTLGSFSPPSRGLWSGKLVNPRSSYLGCELEGCRSVSSPKEGAGNSPWDSRFHASISSQLTGRLHKKWIGAVRCASSPLGLALSNGCRRVGLVLGLSLLIVIPVGARPSRGESGTSGGLGYPDLDSLRRLWKATFFRPKPIIEYFIQPLENLRLNSKESTNLRENVIPFAGVPCTRLWITVRNTGKSPIRRLHARAIIHPRRIIGTKTSDSVIELFDRQFGVPFPFLKRGTAVLPFTEFYGELVYETDVAPNNDIVGTCMVSVFVFNTQPLVERLRTAGFAPEGKGTDIIMMIGQQPLFVSFVGDGAHFIELGVKSG